MSFYLLKPRDRIFVKGYVFLPFTENMPKTIATKTKQ